MTRSAILNRITHYYLESPKFNGMPASSLAYQLTSSLYDLADALPALISAEAVSVRYGDIHPNPFIRALPDESIETQLQKLSPERLAFACIFPLNQHLKQTVDPVVFDDRPFSLRLALGEPQYNFDFFDPVLLDFYMDDVRCKVDHDVQSTLHLPNGRIHFSRASLGGSYGIQFTNLLTANLEQLAGLDATEQRFWESMALPGPCTVHPEVVRTLLEGRFKERISVFEALFDEMRAINALCEGLALPKMFLGDSSPQNELINLGFLPTPTIRSFRQFFLNLQILMIQDVNPRFLKRIEKPTFRSIQRRKSRMLQRPSKTTLGHLYDWMQSQASTAGEDALLRFVALVKKTRHDLYERMSYCSQHLADHTLLQLQRRLMWYAYQGLKSIREFLERHFGITYPTLHPLVREDQVWLI